MVISPSAPGLSRCQPEVGAKPAGSTSLRKNFGHCSHLFGMIELCGLILFRGQGSTAAALNFESDATSLADALVGRLANICGQYSVSGAERHPLNAASHTCVCPGIEYENT